jgi:hypothetical protein
LLLFILSGIRWSQPYRLPTLSTDTPCPEAERLVTTANVNSHGYFCSFCIELNTLSSSTMTSGTQLSESEWQSDCEYQHHHYLHYLQLFCGHSFSSQECVTVGINLGTVWLLFYYWTSKLINVLLSPSFPNSHHLRVCNKWNGIFSEFNTPVAHLKIT